MKPRPRGAAFFVPGPGPAPFARPDPRAGRFPSIWPMPNPARSIDCSRQSSPHAGSKPLCPTPGWRVWAVFTDLLAATDAYRSASQIARIATEQWAAECMFCPGCGCAPLSRFAANRPVADFFCASCGEQYELKSSKSPFGRTLANGAYAKKLERLESDSSPNLLLLQYDPLLRLVVNLTAVPKRFFTHSIIEKRRPLSAHARRAGWVGSNIHLHLVPSIGRIQVIANGVVVNRDEILDRWSRTAFIEDAAPSARGWVVDVLACVEKIDTEVFGLGDLYSFEDHLQSLYPSNRNVRPKIRQQLQVLRENGLLEFLGRGRYRKLL